MAESGIVAIEWAEKLPRSVPGATRVRLEDLGGDSRLVTIERLSEEPGADYSDR